MAQRGRSEFRIGWVLTWPLTLALAAMLFLTARELTQPAWDVAAPIGGPDWEARFVMRVDAITAALRSQRIQLGQPVEERKGAGSLRWVHRRYAVSTLAQDEATIELAVAGLAQLDPGLTVTSQATPEGVELHVGLDGLLTHTIVLHRGAPAQPPRVAMMIVALGDDLRIAREFVDVDGPVALGVRPFRPFSKEVAELAHHFQREVWIDLTPRAAEDDDADGVELAAEHPATGAYLDAALASVPHAVGIADDITARQRSAAAAPDLRQEAQRRNLLYFSAAPVAADQARQSGPTHPAAVSIGAGSDSGGSDQLTRLGSQAQAHGPVIGLGQPNAISPQALRQVVPEWRAAGIDVVSVSTMLQPAALSAR